MVFSEYLHSFLDSFSLIVLSICPNNHFCFTITVEVVVILVVVVAVVVLLLIALIAGVSAAPEMRV